MSPARIYVCILVNCWDIRRDRFDILISAWTVCSIMDLVFSAPFKINGSFYVSIRTVGPFRNKISPISFVFPHFSGFSVGLFDFSYEMWTNADVPCAWLCRIAILKESVDLVAAFTTIAVKKNLLQSDNYRWLISIHRVSHCTRIT